MTIFPKKLNLKTVFVYSVYSILLPLILIFKIGLSRNGDGFGQLLALGEVILFWLVISFIFLVIMLVKSEQIDWKNQMWYAFVFIILNPALFYFLILVSSLINDYFQFV